MTTPSEPTTPPPAEPARPTTYWQAPKEEAGPAPGVKFASHGSRLIAYVIDSLIVTGVFMVIFIVGSGLFVGTGGISGFRWFGQFDGTRIPTPAVAVAWGLFGIFVLVAVILAFAYFPFFWARSGQTPGMRPFGLYVVRDSDGGRISGGQALLRVIGMWISGIPFYLGFIWIFIDGRRRGWHDLISGTVVIERTPPG